MYNDNMVLNATNSNNNHKSLIQITPEKLTISCLDNSDVSMTFDDGFITTDAPVISSSSSRTAPEANEFITKAYADATYSGGGGGGVTYAQMVHYVDSVMLVSKAAASTVYPHGVMLSLHNNGNLALHNCSYSDATGWNINAGKVMFSEHDFSDVEECYVAYETDEMSGGYILALLKHDTDEAKNRMVLVDCKEKKLLGVWTESIRWMSKPQTYQDEIIWYNYVISAPGGGSAIARHSYIISSNTHTRTLYTIGEYSTANFLQSHDDYLYLNVLNSTNPDYEGFYRINVWDFTDNEKICDALDIRWRGSATPGPPSCSQMIWTKNLTWVLLERMSAEPIATFSWTVVSDIIPGYDCNKLSNGSKDAANMIVCAQDRSDDGFIFGYFSDIGAFGYTIEEDNSLTSTIGISVNMPPTKLSCPYHSFEERISLGYPDFVPLWSETGVEIKSIYSGEKTTTFSQGGKILTPPLYH
jgi:hypothetical protein